MRSPKTLKILFLLASLLGLNICSSHPLSSDRITDFKAGVCSHNFCQAKRLEQNTGSAIKHELDTKNFAQNLEKYEKNKGRNRGIITIGSILAGASIGSFFAYKSPKGYKLFNGGLYAIAGFSLPLVLGLIFHRLTKPGEPVLCLTTECFISNALAEMQKYRSQTKFDARWWQSLDSTNLSMSVRTKFSDRTYPFEAALNTCSNLLDDLNRTEIAAEKLQEASSFDIFSSQTLVNGSELSELREMHEKIFAIKSNIENSYELAMERKLKQQEQEKLEAQRRAEIERFRRHMAENEADFQRRQAQDSEYQKAQIELAKAKEAQEQRRKSAQKASASDLEKRQQQTELDYWKNKQIQDQKKELDHYNSAKKAETDPAAQQKELDYWNAQKAQKDARIADQNRRNQEAQIARDLKQKHEEHLRQKAVAQAAAERERAEQQRREAAQAQAKQAQRPANQPTPAQPKEERTFGADECACCYEVPRNPRRLDCGHVFCSVDDGSCVAKKWIEEKKECPCCFKKIK